MSVMMRLLLLCILLRTTLEHDAYFIVTNGFRYQPSNNILHLSTFIGIQKTSDCARSCFSHLQCRTFTLDQDTGTCQHFEGSIDTGSVIPSTNSDVIGWLNIRQSDYALYHASFDQCANHHYLYSNAGTGLCECPAHTFWNGSICLNQGFTGDHCLSDQWCRSDLNLRCVGLNCADNSTAMVPTNISTTTTTLTTVSTTTLTAALPCATTFSSNGSLYYVVNPSLPMNNYTCFARTWIATGTSATLSFTFRNDPGFWSLDSIAVYHGVNQILINGGFDNGTAGWSQTGTCESSGQVYHTSSLAHSGSYYYVDGCVNSTYALSQTFSTVIGDNYQINFWLKNDQCCSPIIIANVTIG